MILALLVPTRPPANLHALLAQAATVILDGVRAGRWRILVGDDAHVLDEGVRSDPTAAYDGGVTLPSLMAGS